MVWDARQKKGTLWAPQILLHHFHRWRFVHRPEERGLGDFPHPAAASPPLGCSLIQLLAD